MYGCMLIKLKSEFTKVWMIIYPNYNSTKQFLVQISYFYHKSISLFKFYHGVCNKTIPLLWWLSHSGKLSNSESRMTLKGSHNHTEL